MLSVHEIVNEGCKRRELRSNEPSNPNNERLVKLRNPWGEGEWKGDWGDKSSKWNPELRQQLDHMDADDGIFFMPFKEWLRYFYDYQLCYYHDDYLYSA